MDRRTFLRFFNLAWLVAFASAIKSKAQAMNSQPVIFYVAPNGNDVWSGKLAKPSKFRRDGPFATLSKARDAIRELKLRQGKNLNQPVTVMVRGGTYYLSEPLIFKFEDSGTEKFPISYQAYANEKPIISGGKPITNWKKQGDVWVADLPDVKVGKWSFRVLRVNNNWAIRARYPKFNPNNPLKDGYLFAPSSSDPELSYNNNNKIIAITPQQFPNWKNWDGAEVHIFLAEGYLNAILPVTSVDKQSHKLFVNSNMNIKPGNRFFIDNVREALTSPGEWYLNKKTGELLYWPVEPNFPNNIEIVAPIIDRLIVLQGDHLTDNFVQYIHLQGLTFKDSDYTLPSNYFEPLDAAIWLSGTQHCLIENCHFTRLAGHAVQLEKGSRDNQIIRNKISQMGQGGVLLSGKDENDQPRRNLVAANDIHDSGQIHKHVAGVYFNCGSENRVSYNRIARMPRYGVGMISKNEKLYS
jgi:hypothetical protein